MKTTFCLKFALVLFITGFVFDETHAQKRPVAVKPPVAKLRSVIVQTEPQAFVWLDDLRRGTSDATGKLKIERVSGGTKRLRVRARGFTEKTVPLLPAQTQIKVALALTSDAAVLKFQEAEEMRETAKNEADKQKAVELYRKALELRPKFAEAHLGLARSLEGLSLPDEALEELAEARKDKPNYAEASAVEARIYAEVFEEENAITSATRAIREGKGIQPEAYTVLGNIYRGQQNYEEAIKAYKKAVAQLADSEPALYQLLGRAYEEAQNFKEAVKAYEKVLEIAPESQSAGQIRGFIDQLRRQAAEEN